MIKRKKLGQHFLNSKSIAEKIISEANISPTDIVFELGTGKGILTSLLAAKSQKVISIDADETLVKNAKEKFFDIPNLEIRWGDGLAFQDTFSIFVSNLPYSISKESIEWLAKTPFSHGVIMVQKEFAEKLLSKSPKNRRSINIIANYALEIQKILAVGKKNFSPNPKVDSVILKLTKKRSIDEKLIEIINKIFSYKRKKISNILKQFGLESSSSKRLNDLSTEEIVEIAKQISDT
jgi:16S rRNA (adenine1518-N6/adenine1519-N6)-dimethyltransferase